MTFIIVDKTHDPIGYARHSPIDGWIFTILLNRATEFPTKTAAENAIQNHYNNRKDLTIESIHPKG